MKLIYILIVFNISIISLNAKTLLEYFDLIDIQGIQIESTKLDYNNIFYYNKSIYLAMAGRNSIILMDLNNKGKEYKLILPDSIDYKPWLESILISNDSIFCFDLGYRIHCFHLFNDSCYHIFSASTSISGKDLKKINNRLYLYDVSYNSKNILNHQFANLKTIDLENERISKLHLPTPSGAGFSFFYSSRVMDGTDSLVFLSDFDRYNIRIFDMRGNLVDSIHRNPEQWVETTDSIPQYPRRYFRPVVFMNDIRPFTGKISTIQKIDLLGEDKLLVCWSVPMGGEFNYKLKFDIWQKTDFEWVILYEDIDGFNEKYSDNEYVSVQKINTLTRYRIINNYLVIISLNNPISLIKEFLGKSYLEYLNARDNYYLNNDIESIIGVYKLK